MPAHHALSSAIVALAAATVFFAVNRRDFASVHRTALTLVALVTLVALHADATLLEGWTAARDPAGEAFRASGRCLDRLLSVPLLLAALVLVLRLPPREAWVRGARLGAAGAAMAGLCYAAEVGPDPRARLFCLLLATAALAAVLAGLFGGLAGAIDGRPGAGRGLVRAARWTLVLGCGAWLAAVVPSALGRAGGDVLFTAQVGSALADAVFRVCFGVLIYLVACREAAARFGRVGRAAGTAEGASFAAE